jgi:hypothetical protein
LAAAPQNCAPNTPAVLPRRQAHRGAFLQSSCRNQACSCKTHCALRLHEMCSTAAAASRLRGAAARSGVPSLPSVCAWHAAGAPRSAGCAASAHTPATGRPRPGRQRGLGAAGSGAQGGFRLL